ncbi:MAG: hypothetical protein AB4911_06395 [Oscillochloridaceae bacterium umkhey_bin13]
MVIQGYIHLIKGNLQTTQIIDPALVAAGDPALIAAGCLVERDPGFAERVREGDLLVLDGALRGDEHAEAAIIALQAVGLAAVICAAADPAIISQGMRYGLPVLIIPAAAQTVREGDLLRLDLERGQLEANGARWTYPPLPADALTAVRRVQLLSRMRRVVEDEGFAE